MRAPTLALLVAVCTAAASARAQEPAAARAASEVVARVEFTLDGQPVGDGSLATLQALVDVRVGEPLEPADVRESIQHLVHLRRFASIDVYRERTPAGLVVRFALMPLQRIVRYEVTGALEVSSGDLERAVRDRVGSTSTSEQVPDALLAVQDALGERGYLQPTLSSRLEPLDAEGNVRLVIEGSAGQRWRLGRIQLVGIEGPDAAAAREELGLSPGDQYDRRVLQKREQRFIARQRSAGYYETVVRTTPSPGSEPYTIDLQVEVVRGPRVALTFTGDPLPAAVRRDLVPVEAEGSVDEDLLEDSRARIVRWLRDRGHWRAEVDYARQATDAGLDIVFTVRAGRLYLTGDIVLGGQRAVTEAEMRDLLRLRRGQVFSPALLDESEAAIVRVYHARGYPAARVERALVDVSEPSLDPNSRGTVEVRLRIVEGPEARVAAVAIEGVTALPLEALQQAISVREGELFSSAAVVADRELLVRRYLDEGYRQAQVETDLTGGADGRSVAVTYRVTEGVQSVVDRVVVVGNVRISDETIRRELRIASGDPLGLSRVFETQRRLTALGLFRSIRITDVAQPGTSRYDVIVTVEEAPVTTIGYGAGLEGGQRLRTAAGVPDPLQPDVPVEPGVETRFEFAPRGFFEVGRRNFLGKNRSVNLFLRGSLRPRDVPGDPERDGTGLAVSEYRVLGTWREPRAIFATTNLDVSAFVEQAIRSSFNFRRQAARVEMSRLAADNVTLIARYGFGRTELFNARVAPEDQLNVDRLFPQVRLSSVSTSTILDTRDDPLDPQRGYFASIDGELAGRSIGSEVGFTKTYMQGFAYRRLPGSRVVVAAGARLGIARGLPRDVERLGDDGQPLVDPEGEPIVDIVRDLPASERFFAGGDATVRGFALDRLGAPATLDRNGLPTGGNALIVFNSEVRFPVWKSIGAAAFVDAGNVFLRVADLDLGDVRGAAGFGLRYRSPIGPIRVDLGFKLTRRTFINGTREGRTALHITVGQAF
jgi:outer membrane protein insertion porin family